MLLILTLAFSQGFETPAYAETSQVRSHDPLEANRALLSRYKSEYSVLREELKLSPTLENLEKLEGLKYKILALNEDRQRLLSSLPENDQAHQMMLDVLTRKEGVELPEEEMRVPESTGPETLSKSSQTLDRITSLHQKALDLVAERRYLEAAKIYEEIVITEPEDDQAYLIMGHVYLLSGAPGKAEEAFSNAVHIDPANIQEITPFYENIILQNPDDDDGYANLGFARLIVGDFLKAREAFLHALEINPENQTALQGINYLDNH